MARSPSPPKSSTSEDSEWGEMMRTVLPVLDFVVGMSEHTLADTGDPVSYTIDYLC